MVEHVGRVAAPTTATAHDTPNATRSSPAAQPRLGLTEQVFRKTTGDVSVEDDELGHVPGEQSKLSVSQPGDPDELQADRVADRVMSTTESAAGDVAHSSSQATTVQRKQVPGAGQSSGAGALGVRSTGQPLPSPVRSFFEPHFGADLGNVRVHTDDSAGRAAESIGARAFTLGSDIAFARDEFTPSTLDGKRLLAHELTHVMQQSRRGSVGADAAAGGTAMVKRQARPNDSAATPSIPAGMTSPQGASVIAPDSGMLQSSQAGASGQAALESPHGEVNKKPVGAVGADLHSRLERYAKLVPSMRSGAAATQKDEIDWYANRGVGGWFIDLWNKEKTTDPKRWDAVLHRWDDATTSLKTSLEVPVSAERINDKGQAGQDALNAWQDAAEQTRLRREEYSKYLLGFTSSAGGVVTVSSTVRDVSFAAAIGVAVVVWAPAVAGAVASFGTGTLGMTAGSTSLSAFTYGGTGLAMGAVGASMEGAGQGIGTLGAQASMAMSDLIRGRSKAADNFDFNEVSAHAWDGMKRGFVDGVLAFTGVEAEKAIASASGPALRAMFGPGNSSLYALLLRRTLQRAVSAGVTGSVIGALQAGYRAAAEGQDLGGIESAMKHGFVIGGVAGATLGGAGGALEARGANQLRIAVASELRAVAEASPATMESDKLVQDLLTKLRANPTPENQKILELTPRVWKALHDPDRIGAALAEVWLEEHLLGVMAPQSAEARFGAAAQVLAKRRGAPVRILPRSEDYTRQRFFDEVVVTGDRFLDYSVLNLSQEHGVTTHIIQDFAVDNVLYGTGMRAEQYRELFAKAVAADGTHIGADLWDELYDSFQGGINQPEVVYPAMRKAINIP